MSYLDIPLGNGQKVYVDLDWVNEEFICYLEEKGYEVLTDCSLVDDDTFCLYPCLDTHIHSCKEEYQSKRDAKIDECFVGEKVQKPLTVGFPKDKFPEEVLAFPFVLKNTEAQGGMEKFLIKNQSQLNLLRRFYDEINLYDRQQREARIRKDWSCLGELVFDENGHSNKGISMFIFDYRELFYQKMVMQEYIKTPTKYNTSMRVLTSSSGDILCASLKYNVPAIESAEKEYTGYFDTYLSRPDSPYYLGNESIISNTVAGGNSILLGKDRYSIEEREILAAHNIDFVTADVPESIRRVASKIAICCSREIGAICGMDFIYDSESKTWKYLEEHEFPMLSSYAEAYGFEYTEDPYQFMSVHSKVEIDARLRALSLFMKKKQIETKKDHSKVLKYK